MIRKLFLLALLVSWNFFCKNFNHSIILQSLMASYLLAEESKFWKFVQTFSTRSVFKINFRTSDLKIQLQLRQQKAVAIVEAATTTFISGTGKFLWTSLKRAGKIFVYKKFFKSKRKPIFLLYKLFFVGQIFFVSESLRLCIWNSNHR